jgi:hypothetical protein
MQSKAWGARAGDKPLEPMDIERRTPGAHDVQIEIAFCGVCHSDLHTVRSEWGGTLYPCVPGHAFAPNSHLTSIIDWWGPYYTETIQALIDGTWTEHGVWKGIKDGEVVIGPYNPKVPADVVEKAEAAKNGIADGSVHPFAGPIKDNTGAERVAAGDIIDDGEYWGVDWYFEGVIAP